MDRSKRNGKQGMSLPCRLGKSCLPLKGQEAEELFQGLSDLLETAEKKVNVRLFPRRQHRINLKRQAAGAALTGSPRRRHKLGEDTGAGSVIL